jgi:hypothetical protein
MNAAVSLPVTSHFSLPRGDLAQLVQLHSLLICRQDNQHDIDQYYIHVLDRLQRVQRSALPQQHLPIQRERARLGMESRPAIASYSNSSA